MRKHLFFTSAIAMVFCLSGCMGEASPVRGILFADVQYAGFATQAANASKSGEACAKSILTLFAFGDATVTAAKTNGGITQVSAIEHSSFNVLGIYGKWCTIVKGS